MRTALPATLLTALVLSATGCGARSDASELSAPPTTVPAPAAAEPTPAATTPADSHQGHHGVEIEAFPAFGFVLGVDASRFPAMVVLDDAELLTGADAEAALIEDHGEVPEGAMPNGFYLRNTNPGTAEYPMAGNVVITVVDADGSEQVLTPQQWEQLVTAHGGDGGEGYRPYHLSFEGSTVVEVRSQHLP